MGVDDALSGWSRRGSRVRRLAHDLRSPRTEREREHRRIVVLCLPFALLALFAGVVPLAEMLRISVSTARFESAGFALDAYATLVTDPYYRGIAVTTLWFALATVAASLAVAIPVTHALEKYDLPRKRLLVSLVSFPNSVPGIVAAFMIIVLFGNSGVLTGALAFLTGRAATDVAIATGVVGLFFGFLYTLIPRAVLLLRGSYAEVDTDAEEAARSLGASPARTFYYVTLPAIRPGVIGAAILCFRTALAIFGTVLVLQGLLVWTLQLDRELATGFDVQVASAMATVWFALVLLVTFLGLRYTDAEVGL
jgi:putative spermidine/putrescine transport system permease protein